MAFPITANELKVLQQKIQKLAKDVDIEFVKFFKGEKNYFDNIFYVTIPVFLNEYFDISDDIISSLNSITADYFRRKLNGKSNVNGVTADALFDLFNEIKKIRSRISVVMPKEMKEPTREAAYSGAAAAVSDKIKANNNDSRKTTAQRETQDNPFLLKGTPLSHALKAHYQTHSTLKNLLSDNRQPISHINLSIVETHKLIKENNSRRNKHEEEQKVPFPEVNSRAQALSYYEEEYNIKELIAADDIFAAREKDIKIARRIMISGRAGIGKTAMSQYFAYQWSQGGLWSDRFDYVFWIPLRKLAGEFYKGKKVLNLVEIIKHECISNDFVDNLKDEDITEILKYNSKQVLFVLDGYDEVVHWMNKEDSPLSNFIQPLLEKKGICAEASIILTSRPHHLPDLHYFDRQMENMGFNDENITHYVKNYFSFFQKGSDAKGFLDFLKLNPSIWGSAHIPLNLALICEVQLKSSLVDMSLTVLYQEIVNYLLKKYLKKQKIDTDNRSIEWLYQQLTPEIAYMESLAFGGLISAVGNGMPNTTPSLQKETLTIIEKEYKPLKSNEQPSLFNSVLGLDFLKTVYNNEHEPAYSNIQALEKEHYFIHRTFQEFFAARYLVHSLRLDSNTGRYKKAFDFIKQNRYHPSYQIMFGFVAGILRLLSKELSPAESTFWNILLDPPLDMSGMGHFRLVVRCLEEAGCDPQIPQRDRLLSQIAHRAKAWVTQGDELISEQFYSILKGNIQVIKDSNIINVLLEMLNSEDITISSNGARSLSQLGQTSSRIISRLLEMLPDRSCYGKPFGSFRSGSIVWALFALGHANEEVILALLTALGEKDFNSKDTIVSGFREFGNTEDKVIDALIIAGRDHSLTARVVIALRQLIKKRDRIVQKFLNIFNSNEALEIDKQIVVQVLGSVRKPNEEIIRVLLSAVSNSNPLIQRSAIYSLGQFGEATEQVITALQGVDSKDPYVYSAVIQALGNLGQFDNGTKTKLLEAFTYEHEPIIEAAVIALGKLQEVSNDDIEKLIAVFDKKTSGIGARFAAVEALEPFALSNEKVVATLLKTLDDDAPFIQQTAVQALGLLAQSSDEIINKLLAMLGAKKYESNYYLKVGVVQALVHTGNFNDKIIQGFLIVLADINKVEFDAPYAKHEFKKLPFQILLKIYFNSDAKNVEELAILIAELMVEKSIVITLAENGLCINVGQTLKYFTDSQDNVLAQLLCEAIAKILKEKGLPDFYLRSSLSLKFQDVKGKGAYTFSRKLADQAIKIQFDHDHIDYKKYPRAIRDQAYSCISESCSYLDLSNNQLDDKAIQLFVPILMKRKLYTLILSHNRITEAGLEYLLYALAKKPSVKHLILDHNYIAFDGDFCQNKLEPLVNEADLEKLDLSMNFIFEGLIPEETILGQSRKIVYSENDLKQISEEKKRYYIANFFVRSPVVKSNCEQSTVASIINLEKKIDVNCGVVALMAYKKSEHAFLVLEGIHQFGQRFLIMGDLYVVDGCILISIIHSSPEDYLKRTKDRQSEQQLVYSECVRVSKDKIEKMKEKMLEYRELKGWLRYALFPNESKGEYNCLTWAWKVSRDAGIHDIPNTRSIFPSGQVKPGEARCLVM